ncbi:extracellular solute-binding protein [Synechococcus sp. M16CYN]|uniref:extracellular solute-binding protein n=1 Tax=Synechococcus sp. M16CYN TaxID=3103139 RepID=UPI00324DD57F
MAIQIPNTAREVLVYSGRYYNTDRQAFKAFNKLTKIKVRLIEADGMTLIERLKREGTNSRADVILLVDAARINNAAKEGLLAPIESNQLTQNIPVQYRDPKHRWFGLTRRVRAVIVNPKLVEVESIKSYDDLANPNLKGKLCLRKRKNVYNQSLVADQIIQQGETKTISWVQGMIKNVNQPFFGGDTSLIRAVGQGQCGVGVVNHYYLARMQAGANGKKDKLLTETIKLIMPNPAHVNISAAGMVKSARNKAEAIKLISFLASPKGSIFLTKPTYEYPINGFGESNELKKFGRFNSASTSISKLGSTQKRAIQIMTNYGWR